MITILISCTLIICLFGGYVAEPDENRATPSHANERNRKQRGVKGLGDPASSRELAAVPARFARIDSPNQPRRGFEN